MNKAEILFKIKRFVLECKRVLKITKKPSNEEFKTIYESQQAYMAKARKWTQMSEYYYLQTSELVEE